MPEDAKAQARAPRPAAAVAAQVRRVRASGEIIRQLEEAIVLGRLAAGDRLPSERDLREQMEVSRNTLREGLRVLEQKGLVEIRKGRRGGIFVRELTAGPMAESLGLFVQSQRVTMEEISEFRQDLEGLLARRTAQRAGPAGLEELRRLLRRAEALAEAGPGAWEAFMEADKEVHLALARLGGNLLHYFFLETVHDNLHHWHITAYLPRDAEMIRTTLAELRELVGAVALGDGDRAEALAREHVRRATAIMRLRQPDGTVN